eukprot:3599248-Alexandrium_andersonii.AAC.1
MARCPKCTPQPAQCPSAPQQSAICPAESGQLLRWLELGSSAEWGRGVRSPPSRAGPQEAPQDQSGLLAVACNGLEQLRLADWSGQPRGVRESAGSKPVRHM